MGQERKISYKQTDERAKYIYFTLPVLYNEAFLIF